LGIVFQRTGRLDEAVISYKESIALNPHYADSHYNLGNVFRHKESPDEAIECFQRALRLNPHFPEASGALKIALKEKEQLIKKYENINWINMIGKKLRLESLCHPHCEEERAYLFRTFDGGGTEMEVLNFLRSLIALFKPTLVLETGTWNADGTVALGTAVKENGFGKVISLEIDFQRAEKARMKIHSLALSEYAEVINVPSLEYIEKLDGSKYKFDFAFFDSRPSIRPVEFQKLYDKGALTDIVAFHDTSRLREVSYIEKGDPQDEYVRRLDQIELQYCRGGLESSLSKGIRIMQLRRDINPAFHVS
jgi:predicted O-methyltransferase YrrM